MAGTVDVPAAKRNVAWDEVIRRTRGSSRDPPVSVFVDTNVIVRHVTGDLLPIWPPTHSAYLVSCAETTGVNRVASFDRTIDRVSTVTRVEPPQV